MSSTPELKTSTPPKKHQKSIWSSPFGYIVAIVIAILIIAGIIFLCYKFFPSPKRLPSVFYERGTSALKEFSAGAVDCAR
jgi:hypothetical protein